MTDDILGPTKEPTNAELKATLKLFNAEAKARIAALEQERDQARSGADPVAPSANACADKQDIIVGLLGPDQPDGTRYFYSCTNLERAAEERDGIIRRGGRRLMIVDVHKAYTDKEYALGAAECLGVGFLPVYDRESGARRFRQATTQEMARAIVEREGGSAHPCHADEEMSHGR